jgi:hypothetical protein
MRSYLKKSFHPYKPLVLWVVQMIDQLSILLTHPLHHTNNAFLLANDRLHEVATEKFQEAFELLDDCISMLQKFECGTGTIPFCPLLQANEAKATKAKLDKAPKGATGADSIMVGLVTPDTKRQRTGKAHEATPSTNDLSALWYPHLNGYRHDALS